MVVEFRGRTRREYTKRNGDAAVAHNLVVELPSGEAGTVFVAKEVYDRAAAFDKGDAVSLVIEGRPFRGEVQLRVVGVEAA